MYIFGGSSDKGILSDLHRINLEDVILPLELSQYLLNCIENMGIT